MKRNTYCNIHRFRSYHLICLFIFLVIFAFFGCKKLVDVGGPVTSLNSSNVFSSDVNAASVLTGIYTSMMTNALRSGGITSTTLFTALSSDELVLYGGSSSSQKPFVPYYLNSLNSSNITVNTAKYYSLIYVINSAIEGLTASNHLTPSIKQQLLGEAKFMRAFCYFYLTNLFGDVPLVLSTDYKKNSNLAKSTQDKVYDQIITDLIDSRNNLNELFLKANASTAYSQGQEERLRPTKWAANAMLARVYLYTKKWTEAEKAATEVIDHKSLFQLTSLDNTFLKNNSEAIWQLQPVAANINTEDGFFFILPAGGPSATGLQSFYLNHYLTDSFEEGDQRAMKWINSVVVNGIRYYFPFKYKVSDPNAPVTEYSLVLRVAEQFLIRAEARIENGNIAEGISDLNLIRDRATDTTIGSVKLPQLSINLGKEDALHAVLHERQTELFMEWGHRWFDLKRTGQIDEVMKVVTLEKGGLWKSTSKLYPFSQYDLTMNPNLTQNPGY